MFQEMLQGGDINLDISKIVFPRSGQFTCPSKGIIIYVLFQSRGVAGHETYIQKNGVDIVRYHEAGIWEDCFEVKKDDAITVRYNTYDTYEGGAFVFIPT